MQDYLNRDEFSILRSSPYEFPETCILSSHDGTDYSNIGRSEQFLGQISGLFDGQYLLIAPIG